MTLYRKYRPQAFRDVLGQESVTAILEQAVKSNKVAHAYLFAGSRGTGKTSVARILAKALNCLEQGKGREALPCNQCAHCQAINSGSFLDVLELDAASNRGIDEIRQLKEGVAMSPVLGKRKIYILDEVHMLTNEAFNALLKTLEEPPAHAVFILCTTEAHKVPVTIQSRCQRFTFARASVPDIERQLQDIAVQEGVAIEAEAVALLAQLADGGYRDAAMLFEQVALDEATEPGGERKITRTLLEQRFGLARQELVNDLVQALLTQQADAAIAQIEHFATTGGDIGVLTASLIERLRLLLYIKVSPKAAVMMVDPEQLKVLQQQVAAVSEPVLLGHIKRLLEAQQKRPGGYAPLLLELALLGDSLESTTPFVAIPSPTTATTPKTAIPASPPNPVARKAPVVVEEPPEPAVPEVAEVVVAEANETIEPMFEHGHAINAAELLEAWTQILVQVKVKNHMMEAVLRDCTPLGFDGTILLLQFWYDFHKRQVETDKNRRLLEDVVTAVLGTPVKIKCQLGDKTKRPKRRPMSEEDVHNVGPVAEEGNIAEAAAEIFGGEFLE